jgi:hypothetical protein
MRRSWGEKKIGKKKRREEGEIVGRTWERKMTRKMTEERKSGKGEGEGRGRGRGEGRAGNGKGGKGHKVREVTWGRRRDMSEWLSHNKSSMY